MNIVEKLRLMQTDHRSSAACVFGRVADDEHRCHVAKNACRDASG